MKHSCKYHPGEQATWYCQVDGIHFCEDCVASDDSEDGGRARCFLCNKPLEKVGRQHAQEPFWQILSHFVEYPLVREVMLMLAAVALVSAVIPASWIGVAIGAAIGLPLGVTAVAMIEHTVQAQMRAPGFDALRQSELYAKGAQYWLVCVAAMVATGYGFVEAGMLKGTLLALLIWLLVPLVLLQVVVESSLVTVLLAPQRLLGTLVVIGVDYLLAAAFLFGAMLAVAILASIVYDLLPNFVAFPLAVMLIGWFVFAGAHLLGYLLCQHREKLGYTSALQDESGVRQRRARRPEEERRMAVWLREGRYEKVVSSYKTKLEKQGGSLSLNEQYEKVLAALQRQDELLEHATHFVELLLKNQQEYRVMELVKRYRKLDPGFRPSSVQGTWDVAKLLAENGDAKNAVNLLLDLHKRAPTWPGLAEAYLFVARLLKKEFNLDNKANQYIRFVETRFRDEKNRQLARQCRDELGIAAG